MEKYLEYEKTVIELEEKINDLKRFADGAGVDLSGEITKLQQKLDDKKEEVYSNYIKMAES